MLQSAHELLHHIVHNIDMKQLKFKKPSHNPGKLKP